MASEPTTQSTRDPSAVRLYSPRVLAAYFILGSLPVGACLYGLNLARRGDRRMGYILFVTSALSLITLAAAVGRGYNPFLWNLLAILLGIGIFRMERHPYKTAIDAGATAARWWPPMLGVLALILVMGLVWPEDKVVFGPKEEIYYEKGATEADARRLGSALRSFGLFDGRQRASVVISRGGHGVAACFVVGHDAWKDSAALRYFQDVRSYLTTGPFSDAPLEVRLCDNRLRTKAVISQPTAHDQVPPVTRKQSAR
jgi:hypothetical protein